MKPFVIVVMVLILIWAVASCGGGHDTSYYMDYNNNGQMDSGEHAYDEYSDGSEHYDYNGDGWNEN